MLWIILLWGPHALCCVSSAENCSPPTYRSAFCECKATPPDSNAIDLADMLSALYVGDGNNAEQTCGAFATALDAAKAHDAEALRVYGPAAEAMLNFPMTNYPNVSNLCAPASASVRPIAA